MIIQQKSKDNKNLFSYFISASFNNALDKGVFSDKLKYADIKVIYKKESRNEKENYRTLSILQNLSKIVIYMISLLITLIRYCQNISTDLASGLV